MLVVVGDLEIKWYCQDKWYTGGKFCRKIVGGKQCKLSGA